MVMTTLADPQEHGDSSDRSRQPADATALDHVGRFDGIPSASLPGAATSPASSSPTPGVSSSSAACHVEDSAFSAWRDELKCTIVHETRALQDHVIDLQRDFDDASQYIRGDFAWRKQVAAFHDRTNDMVALAMELLSQRLQQRTQSLGKRLEDTLQSKDAQAKEETQRVVASYEDKLRRTRTTLKKEIDRFAHLEKCLRKEETHQAKVMYDRLVSQLKLEHAAKEAALQAMLRELKLSYLTVENANTQLMETVKRTGEEIERLKKMLPKPSAAAVAQRAANTNTARPSSGAAALSSAAAVASEAYGQSLKQSLASANSTIEALRNEIGEMAASKDAAQKKLRQAEDSVARTNEGLVKVKQLLSESHSTLLVNRKEIESLLQEKTHWKELYTDLHFKIGSHEHDLDDVKRLAGAAQLHLESLEAQLKRKRGLQDDGGHVLAFSHQWTRWREKADVAKAAEGLELVETFLARLGCASTDPRMADDEETSADRDLEAKLRLEFEKKYGDILNIRMSHERKRVLARIEMIWTNRAAECGAESRASSLTSKRAAASKGTRHPVNKLATEDGGDRPSRGLSLKQLLQLVSEAFWDLGFSDWSSTDTERLHSQVTSLRESLQAQQQAFGTMQQHAETQALGMARTDLQLREKEILLAELTDRYRVLRAHLETLQNQGKDATAAPPTLDLSAFDRSDPFTVYGQPQPIEEKKRLVRARPVSASAMLPYASSRTAGKAAPAEPVAGSRLSSYTAFTPPVHSRHPAPKPFLLSQLPTVEQAPGSLTRTPQQHEDHVRSVLKADLLSLTPSENQLDDGSHVGADGILQIMQRRRHRK